MGVSVFPYCGRSGFGMVLGADDGKNEFSIFYFELKFLRFIFQAILKVFGTKPVMKRSRTIENGRFEGFFNGYFLWSLPWGSPTPT